VKTAARHDEFLARVIAVIGTHAVVTEASAMAPHAEDWRKRYRGVPLAVVFPGSTEETTAVVRLAGEYGIGLVPQGGNTGLSGGATPDDSGGQIILSLKRMRALRALDAVNCTMTVEAGMTLAEVQMLAESSGLLFPLSLGAEGTATIGGNLATNAGGTAVLRYGNARELCLGLEVVTAQGEVWNGLRGLRKDNTGYDLRDLFIGSEGTLGIITAAVLKLHPRPAATTTALARVASPAAALELLQLAQQRAGAMLTGFEYMAAMSTRLVAMHLGEVARPCAQIIGGRDGQPPGPADSVLIELSHPESESACRALLETVLEQAIAAGCAADALVAQSGAQSAAFWRLRESITLAAAADGPHIKHDIALPISSLPEFISRMDAALTKQHPGIRIINFGHFGDGNLHYNIAPPVGETELDAEGRRAHYRLFLQQHEDPIRRAVHERVIAMQGSISAEHGLGQLRRDEAARYKSPVERSLLAAIKQALDPQGILNPGKVLRIESPPAEQRP
jgi:FAD/FMN-containing dehydrogenase